MNSLRQEFKNRADFSGRDFKKDRRRSRLFFNFTAFIYPLIERQLLPEYRKILCNLNMPSRWTVLDIATGTGILAGAFAEKGHPVTGLDFSPRMLRRARARYPAIPFNELDLIRLAELPGNSSDIVSTGYLLHGLPAAFRLWVLSQMSRIARHRVLIFDYYQAGNWLVKLIERLEGPHYVEFIAAARQSEFEKAELEIVEEGPTKDSGGYWLCRPRQENVI